MIRPAISDDIPEIHTLVIELSVYFLAPGDLRLPDWFAQTLTNKAFEERFIDDEYDSFVCQRDNRIVGYGSIRQTGRLFHLFVAEQYHRQGIATALWQAMKNSVVTDHYTVNASLCAVPIYERFGFRKTEDVQRRRELTYQPMRLDIHD